MGWTSKTSASEGESMAARTDEPLDGLLGAGA